MTGQRLALNLVFAVLGYIAGVLFAAAVYFLKRDTGDTWKNLEALGWALFLAPQAACGGLFVVVTVAKDTWALHRLAILQGALVTIAGPYVALAIANLGVPLPISWFTGSLLVVPPWLIYKWAERLGRTA